MRGIPSQLALYCKQHPGIFDENITNNNNKYTALKYNKNVYKTSRLNVGHNVETASGSQS